MDQSKFKPMESQILRDTSWSIFHQPIHDYSHFTKEKDDKFIEFLVDVADIMTLRNCEEAMKKLKKYPNEISC